MSGLFDKSHRPILMIMAAVLVWGSLHALGAFLLEYDYRKPLVVYGILLAFLGLWTTSLAIRNRRLSRAQGDELGSHPGGVGTEREDPESTESAPKSATRS